MNIQKIFPNNIQKKFELSEFVYNNTDSFIMNTFGLLWESRNLWPYGVHVAYDGTKIVGMHAAAHKWVDDIHYTKTYYIVTDKNRLGQGIAKSLILHHLSKLELDHYYVNSEINSAGIPFFKKFTGVEPEIVDNEFGTKDCVFKASIQDIFKRHEQTI